MTTIVPHELPEYRCIKTVRAAKITAVKPDGTEGAWLEFSDDQRVWVDREFILKHDPKAGGWFVVYKDGYCSWSPGNAFEEGYVPADESDRPQE